MNVVKAATVIQYALLLGVFVVLGLQWGTGRADALYLLVPAIMIKGWCEHQKKVRTQES